MNLNSANIFRLIFSIKLVRILFKRLCLISFLFGNRVVPILLEQRDEYYENIYRNINGLLLPGGGACLMTSHFAKTATKFMIWSKEAANLGQYFPIWGTCLGFEQMFVSMKVLKIGEFPDFFSENLN